MNAVRARHERKIAGLRSLFITYRLLAVLYFRKYNSSKSRLIVTQTEMDCVIKRFPPSTRSVRHSRSRLEWLLCHSGMQPFYGGNLSPVSRSLVLSQEKKKLRSAERKIKEEAEGRRLHKASLSTAVNKKWRVIRALAES